MLESIARTQPVILYVDDLQWAEPTLIDLIHHIADLSASAPILILCTARPELLEHRPDWHGDRLNATTACSTRSFGGRLRALLDQLGLDLDAEARAQ